MCLVYVDFEFTTPANYRHAKRIRFLLFMFTIYISMILYWSCNHIV